MSDELLFSAGISVETNAGEGTGALGCYAKYNGPTIIILGRNGNADTLKAGDVVFLTCSHVLFPAFQLVPEIGAYTPSYSTCCSTRIATPVVDFSALADKDTDRWEPDHETGASNYLWGFQTQSGMIQSPEESVPNHQGRCSLTDCAIAKLDPGVPYANVLFAPDETIPIWGSRDLLSDLAAIPRAQAGKTPSKSAYVRVYTPRLGQVIHGTLLWTERDTEDKLDTLLVNAETGEAIPDEINPATDPGVEVNKKRISPLFPKGISDRREALDAAMGAIPNKDQFLILPRPPRGGSGDYRDDYKNSLAPLSFDHGDHGSVVIDSDGYVIAQIVRAQEFKVDQFLEKRKEEWGLIEFQNIGNVGVATPIQRVLDRMQISIENIHGSVPAEGPTRVFLPGDVELARLREARDRLVGGLRKSRRGRFFLTVIDRHRREVRKLLKQARAVSAVWHRLQGPGFYHHALQSALEPGKPIPTVINGVRREELWAALLPVVMQHASPALRKDLARHGKWAAATLLQVAHLDEAPAAAARPWRGA